MFMILILPLDLFFTVLGLKKKITRAYQYFAFVLVPTCKEIRLIRKEKQRDRNVAIAVVFYLDWI